MILVRHAESEWNRHYARTRIDPGIPDPPLSAGGRRQAEQLVDRLAAAEVARLVASPYRRTLETATVVAGALDLPIVIEPLVRERCVFSCDLGTSPRELAAVWPDLDFGHLEEQWWGVPAESDRITPSPTAMTSAVTRPPECTVPISGPPASMSRLVRRRYCRTDRRAAARLWVS